jgi:hypothetical protein
LGDFLIAEKQSCQLAASAGEPRRDLFVNFYAKSSRLAAALFFLTTDLH